MGDNLVWIVTGVAAAIAVLCAACRGGKPLRKLAGGAIQGVCALAAVNVAGAFTGVSLGLGWLSLAAAGLLGIPGVAGLLFLQWICR